MDHRVFHLQENDHVITIASAGKTALHYTNEPNSLLSHLSLFERH